MRVVIDVVVRNGIECVVTSIVAYVRSLRNRYPQSQKQFIEQSKITLSKEWGISRTFVLSGCRGIEGEVRKIRHILRSIPHTPPLEPKSSIVIVVPPLGLFSLMLCLYLL